jgi:hypothetical protein
LGRPKWTGHCNGRKRFGGRLTNFEKLGLGIIVKLGRKRDRKKFEIVNGTALNLFLKNFGETNFPLK